MTGLVSFAGSDRSERQLAAKPTVLSRMQVMFRAGADTADIAEAFNLTEANVYNRLARARERAC
jgi:DNA-directed RNA polymerase specialized sigma24 family protein